MSRVFIDFDSIDEDDFEHSIMRHLRQSDVFVLVASEQVFVPDYIHNPDAWVRREIAEALRLGIPIVMARIDGLIPPSADDLPEDIREITGKQGEPFYPEYFQQGITRLARLVRRIHQSHRSKLRTVHTRHDLYESSKPQIVSTIERDRQTTSGSFPRFPSSNLGKWILVLCVAALIITILGLTFVDGIRTLFQSLTSVQAANATQQMRTERVADSTEIPTIEASSSYTLEPDLVAQPQAVQTKMSPTHTRTVTPVQHDIIPDGRVLIPSGTFLMGSTTREDEQPVHEVAITRSFLIDKFEVTNAEYQQCIDAGVCGPPRLYRSRTRQMYYGNSEYSDYPVVYVNWFDATKYCEWKNGRLPTEAEWEYVAGGSEAGTYPWGEAYPTCLLLNFGNSGTYCVGDTSAVGNYPGGASIFEVYDLAGNVWEWVSDWYDAEYYSRSPIEDPQGPFSGDTRVLRGGSWGDISTLNVRISFRDGLNQPDTATDYIGFRCVWDPR